MFYNFIILILIIVLISLLVHELGHLFGAKYLRADRFTISIGSGKKSLAFKKMTLNIYLMIMFHAQTHSERKQNFSNKEYAFITAMGPLFSLLFTFFSVYYY